MWTVWLLTCSLAFFSRLKTWKKDKKSPQQNEVLSLYCTTLGFISENEEYKTRKQKKQLIRFEWNSNSENYIELYIENYI